LLLQLPVKIEFDQDKDAINRQKHGLSLADAAKLDIETATLIPDERTDYGEDRFRAYGWIEERLHMMAFTMRGDVMRVISLRKANTREVRRYDRRR